MKKEFLICDESELQDVANYMQELINSASFVLFYGNLGTGKTTLVKYLLRTMGSRDEVTSPTFSIANWYLIPDNDGSRKVCHIDLYRLEDTDEMINAGIEEIFYSDVVKLIEWPELAESIIPADENLIRVKISQKEDECRKIIIL